MVNLKNLDQVTHSWQNAILTSKTTQNTQTTTQIFHHKLFLFSVERKQHLLGDVEVSAGGSGVKGDPALIVGLVDAGPVFHQEGHHVNIIIYAGLETRREMLVSKSKSYPSCLVSQ